MNREEYEKYYRGIKKVYCPYFMESINFTNLGFEHIRFKNKHLARTLSDQSVRLRLLPIAVKILEKSHTLQGVSIRKRFEERYINNRKEIALLLVHYYEFTAIIDTRKAKVIIKQVEGREKIFLSIIPLFKEKTPPIEGDGFS